ncbi:MAG: COP23 domain-containing protein [Crocosphaera sp.]|nr:COP23 domain-containing protein [Crocosphaera sp.]
MAFDKLNLGLAILGAIIGIAGLGYTIYSDPPKVFILDKKSRFYCELQPDPMKGGEVWSVIYRHNKGRKPWLRMVRSMGDGWDTQRRCDDIARRLDIYREDGLIEFNYRTDPNTPKQYVICAKTKVSGDNCPIILTLMPDDNPYEALREVAGALLPGSLPSYQCNDLQNCPPLQPFTITLEDQL